MKGVSFGILYNKFKGTAFDSKKIEADLTPWHKGGKTISGSCQMLCKQDNRAKLGK
jgi:hypothetical protein